MKSKNNLIESCLNDVAVLIPPVQLAHIKNHLNFYGAEIIRLAAIMPTIPEIGDTEGIPEPLIYLHYFTMNAHFYICEFDGIDKMYGKADLRYLPDLPKYRTLSLSNLKSNQFIELKMNVSEIIFT
jgi:hypothetical protein